MPEQAYEYKSLMLQKTPYPEQVEALNDYAAEGWRVHSPILDNGAVRGYLLERPVE